MRFDGDIIIIDPCSVVKSNSDWHNCEFGSAMNALGFSAFLYTESNSDGVIKVIATDSGEILGSVCTDSCVFAVLLFDEVMRYNPGFNSHVRYPENSVIIHDFHGEITTDAECISGTGNMNFRTE